MTDPHAEAIPSVRPAREDGQALFHTLSQPIGLLLSDSSIGQSFVYRLQSRLVDSTLQLFFCHTKLIGHLTDKAPEFAQRAITLSFLGRAHRSTDEKGPDAEGDYRTRYHQQSLHLITSLFQTLVPTAESSVERLR